MSFISKLGQKIASGIREEFTEAKAAGSPVKAATNELKEVKDDFINGGGAAIGYAEMLGLKYPVHAYQSKVSDQLTRGSRVDGKGVLALKQQGFKGIVNLCAEQHDDESAAKAAGMGYLNLKIIDNTPPTEAQMKQFLDFVGKNQPTYVHCEAGVGRTGVAVACYQMAYQHMSPEAALAEAKAKGCAMPDQQQFILKFGADLAAGKIAGYPVAKPVAA